MAGYGCFRDLPKTACAEFCLHDHNCTIFDHIVQSPPYVSSLCCLYNTTGIKNLTLSTDNSNGLSGGGVFLSKLQSKMDEIQLFDATLTGNYHQEKAPSFDGCKALCLLDDFCDAYNFVQSSKSCFWYSTSDITNIVATKADSAVGFMWSHLDI